MDMNQRLEKSNTFSLLTGSKMSQKSFPLDLGTNEADKKNLLSLGYKGLFVPGSAKEICKLPDRRAYRSMSRSSVLLSKVGLELSEWVTAITAESPYKVGIYAALSNGPEDYEVVSALKDTDPADFATSYKKLRSPKHYLKQLPNLAPAQLGIFLNARGPVGTYTHPEHGAVHAAEAAWFDLKQGLVDAVVVCASFSLEDPLLNAKTKEMHPKSQLAEGAAAWFVTKDDADDLIKLSYVPASEGKPHYGAAHSLIEHLKDLELKKHQKMLASQHEDIDGCLELV